MRHPATLQVNVDHGHYVNVVELQRGRAYDLELTTIAVNQRRARIELAVSVDGGRESLTSVELTNLPTNLGRKPRIVLETAVSRRGSLELSFVVEGRRVTTRRVSVRKWLPTRHALWLVPLAVVAAALLVWLGLRLFAVDAPPMAVPSGDGPVVTEGAGREGGQAEGGGGETTAGDQPSEAESSAAEGAAAGGETTAAGEGSAAAAGDAGDAADAPSDAAAADAGDAADAPSDAAAADAGDAADAPSDAAAADAGEQPGPEATAVTRDWTVYFRPDDPTLTEEAREALRELIESIQGLVGEERGIASLRLVGHCALAGTEAGRVELSQSRAGNVWRFLRQNGIGQPDELVVRGVGGRNPVTRSEEQQYLNRRVEIAVELEPRP